MDQVSRPLQIALASVVVLAALWMVALRPKDEESSGSDAPSVATPVDAVPKAQAAVAASDAASKASDAASSSVAGDAAAPATPAPAPEPATATPSAAPKGAAPVKKEAATVTGPKADVDGEARVLAALDAQKVVVMLFQTPKAADDRAVARAVRKLDRRGGKVLVRVIPIGQVGRYEAITRGVTVTQSPTTVIVDRNRKARTIVGFTDGAELRQAVGDALRAR